MKEEKFNILIEQISEYIAKSNLCNFHHVLLEDIQKAFPHVKKKHLKKAMKEIY